MSQPVSPERVKAASNDALIEEGRRVLRMEADAISRISDRLGEDFVTACRLVANARGRVIVSGIGKSGIIARKIAATLTSTGTPSTFLHPVEGLHGDLGIVGPDDVAILLSKSGETAELTGLIDFFLRTGVPIIGMTGRPDSALGSHSAVVLDCSVEEEACPHDLAPTTSTTVTLAVGDALAVLVLQLNGFKADDFARFHPGGSLGRRLTVQVADVMVGDGFPTLVQGSSMRQAVVPIAEMRGTVVVVDSDGRLAGVVTAGDLVRLMERNEGGWPEVGVDQVMTVSPQTTTPDERGSAVVHRMESKGIMAMPVLDPSGCVVGIVHLHDLMKAGVV